MIRINLIWRCCIVCLLVIAGSCYHTLAQNVVFTATANANKIGLKDQLQVTFTIQNADNLRTFTPAGYGDFAMLQGPFQSQSTNITSTGSGMVRSTTISLTFILQPKHAGKLTIPGAVAKDATGHTYQSNALNIEVVPGSLAAAQPRRQADPFGDDDPNDPFAAMQRQFQQQQRQMQQAMQQQQQAQQQVAAVPIAQADINKDIFIKVTVDKNKAHVGEQITTSYKLYSRIPMQVGISKLPSLNGFWTQDFDIPKVAKPTEETVDGKKYQVFLLKKSALFPQQAGTLELDPAEAQGIARIIQQVRQRNPFAGLFDDPNFVRAFGGSLMMNDPVFNNGFFNSLAYKDVQVHLKSIPVKITVTQLPENGKPAGYGGAVGSFTIASKIDKTELTTDDAASFTVTIAGSGNLKLIEAPKLSLPNGLESYDPQIHDTITGRSTTISGSKLITYAVTPHTPGDYEIPGIPFSYYNPQTGTYESLQTQPIKIHVKPGKHYTPDVSGNNIALKDINNIETTSLNQLSLYKKPLLFTPGYWAMYAVPLFAFIGLIVWKRRDEELSKDTVLLRSKRANKVALKRLAAAQKLLQQNSRKPFYDEISKAIWLYLSDKLNIPLSSLSRETAKDALAVTKVPDDLKQKIENVITECETALYAQTGSTKEMNHTYQEAINVISELEGIF
jgi:hypothetical protein